MDSSNAAYMARELMNVHGLGHWVFEYDRAKKRAGCCKHGKKKITLSVFYVEHNDINEVKDTILHEIAHALAGSGHGHDDYWKGICIRIGAKPVRCYGVDVKMPKGKWTAKCPTCTKEYHLHRKTKYFYGRWCRYCGKHKGQLTFVLNVHQFSDV